MTLVLKNNASTILAADLSSIATSITVEDGEEFSALGVGDYFYATIQSTTGNFEIVKVTARAGNGLTVTRAQEGTLAIPFASGSRIEQRITAQTIMDMVEAIDALLL